MTVNTPQSDTLDRQQDSFHVKVLRLIADMRQKMRTITDTSEHSQENSSEVLTVLSSVLQQLQQITPTKLITTSYSFDQFEDQIAELPSNTMQMIANKLTVSRHAAHKAVEISSTTTFKELTTMLEQCAEIVERSRYSKYFETRKVMVGLFLLIRNNQNGVTVLRERVDYTPDDILTFYGETGYTDFPEGDLKKYGLVNTGFMLQATAIEGGKVYRLVEKVGETTEDSAVLKQPVCEQATVSEDIHQRLSKTEAERDALQEKLSGLQLNNEALQQELVTMSNLAESLKNQIEVLQKQLLEAELATVDSSQIEQNTLVDSDAFNSNNEKINTLRAENINLEDSVQRLESQNLELTQRIAELEMALKQLQRSITKKPKEPESAKDRNLRLASEASDILMQFKVLPDDSDLELVHAHAQQISLFLQLCQLDPTELEQDGFWEIFTQIDVEEVNTALKVLYRGKSQNSISDISRILFTSGWNFYAFVEHLHSTDTENETEEPVIDAAIYEALCSLYIFMPNENDGNDGKEESVKIVEDDSEDVDVLEDYGDLLDEIHDDGDRM